MELTDKMNRKFDSDNSTMHSEVDDLVNLQTKPSAG